MKRSVSGVFGWVVIVYLSIVLLFCIVWFFPSHDKGHYKNYKRYESKIDVSFNKSIGEVDKYKKLYTENKISKRELIHRLEDGADELDSLYDSFIWKKGDELTKELFVLKKQIIIEYAQMYRNKAKALYKGLYYNETDDMNYINIVIDRYKIKDKLEREKFNIKF